MNTDEGWEKYPIEEILKNKAIDDQFATLFREKKFKRLPNLVQIHVNKENRARYIFANTLCDSAKDPFLIFTEEEIKDDTEPVSTLSIFAKRDELANTTLLLQEIEPPEEMKPISYVGHTKKIKKNDDNKETRVMADKNDVGAVKHSMTVMVAGNRVYTDKWTFQAMNECDIGIERNKDIPQLISFVILQPMFDPKANDARMDATVASLDFNIHLKQFKMDCN